jgi:hypothetical protein
MLAGAVGGLVGGVAILGAGAFGGGLAGAVISGAVGGGLAGGVAEALRQVVTYGHIRNPQLLGAAMLSGVVTGGVLGGVGYGLRSLRAPTASGPRGRQPGPTVDPRTGEEVGRFIVDSRGNVMIEPVGGRTVAAGRGGVDTHTLYPNGSNYQRLNPVGHPRNPTPHAHGHLPGTGPGMRGQGPSIDILGNVVPWNSPEAHWLIW